MNTTHFFGLMNTLLQRVRTSTRSLVSLRFKFSFLFLVFLISNCFALSQTPQQIYSIANEHYKQNKFDSASVFYQQLLANGYENTEVHFNLANALFKTGALGKSILHYEKALKFSPEDEDVLHNLQLANAKTADKIITVPELGIITWWNQFRRMFTSKGWGNLAMVFIWIALAFFVIYLFTELRKTGFVFGALFLLLSLCSFWLMFKQQRCETGPDTAILLAKSAYVKSAPDDASANLFMVHEGLKLQVKDQVGEWRKVRLADGKVGWLRQSEIELI